MVLAEVILVSKKHPDDKNRWVYLDAGIYNGLFDAMGEGIIFSITTPKKDKQNLPSILAGPTCDSLDTIYEKNPIDLPANLTMGDRLVFHHVGAYCTNVSSSAFNGFEPLKTIILA